MDKARRAELAVAIARNLHEQDGLTELARAEAWIDAIEAALREEVTLKPIPMLLWCPECCERHIDVGEFATKSHHTHACQNCGHCWRPAIVATVGVRFLPGFRNEVADG